MKSMTVQSLTRWSIGFLALSLLILMGCTKDEIPTTSTVVPDAAFFQTMEDAGIDEAILPRNLAITLEEETLLLDFAKEVKPLKEEPDFKNAYYSTFLFRFSVFLTGLTRDTRSDAFTAFAPSNSAFFRDLGLRNLIQLIRMPRTALRPVIEYHIVLGRFRARDLSSAFFPTLNGAAVQVNLAADTVGVNQTRVLAVNRRDNFFFPRGIVHIINGILLPPSSNLVEVAVGAAPEFTILVDAVSRAGLVETLAEGGPFTIFAPTNQAFLNLLEDLGASSLDDIPVSTLTQVLLYHVVEGRVYSSDLVDGPVPTLNGDVTINLSDLALDDIGSDVDANLIPELLNIQATNGVIHVIDKVLLPAL